MSGKFPETVQKSQEDSKKIPESFQNLLEIFHLFATLIFNMMYIEVNVTVLFTHF